MNGWKRAVFYGDAHFSYESKPSLDIMYQYLEEHNKDIEYVVDLGDIIDNSAMSTFPVHPDDKDTPQEQFDDYARHVKVIQELVPSSMQYIMTGNHDAGRLSNSKNLNRGIASLRNLQFENILKDSFNEYDVDKNKVNVVVKEYTIPLTKNNNVTIFHGDPRMNPHVKGGVTGARRTAEMYPNMNWLIQGHVHQYREIPRPHEGKSLIVLDAMADIEHLKNAYLNYHPYTNGFGVMHYNKRKDKAVWQHISIDNGEAIIDGKIYKGKKR